MRASDVEVGQTYRHGRSGYFTVTGGERKKANEWSPSRLVFSGTMTRASGSELTETVTTTTAQFLDGLAYDGWRQSLEDMVRHRQATDQLRAVASERFGVRIEVHGPVAAIEHITKILGRQARRYFTEDES